jgi:RNA polymerase sigma factor (sigma-70 family)
VSLWFDVDVSRGSVGDLTYVVTIADRCADVEETRMPEPVELDVLVARARAGDQVSWNALVDRFLPLVNGVIGRFRLSAADADDVNQTVWLRLVEHLGDLREPRALPGWLVTTARNEALRVIRLRGRDLPVDPQGVTLERLGEQPELDVELIRDERTRALRAALLELPAGRRELLELLLTDPPISYDEISAKLGIPKGSIGPTRARALEQLRNTRAMRALVTASAVVE